MTRRPGEPPDDSDRAEQRREQFLRAHAEMPADGDAAPGDDPAESAADTVSHTETPSGSEADRTTGMTPAGPRADRTHPADSQGSSS